MGHLDWKNLVEERDAWVAHNFPDPEGRRTPLDSMLGVIEELGELTHAHLKKAQSIRGSDQEHDEAAIDAIGDLTVYLLGIISFYSLQPSERPQPGIPTTPKYDRADRIILLLGYLVGDLSYLVVLPRRDISRNALIYSVDKVVDLLRKYCEGQGWDYAVIVQQTWAQVRQRDWQAFPDTGLPPAEIH